MPHSIQVSLTPSPPPPSLPTLWKAFVSVALLHRHGKGSNAQGMPGGEGGGMLKVQIHLSISLYNLIMSTELS